MSGPDAPILDETALAQLRTSVNGDRSFVVELIEAFLADGRQQLSAIDAARGEGNAQALVRPAHTLKSSSATVGAMRLSATARAIEIAGRSGEIDDGVDRLQADWDGAAAALRAWVAGEGAS